MFDPFPQKHGGSMFWVVPPGSSHHQEILINLYLPLFGDFTQGPWNGTLTPVLED